MAQGPTDRSYHLVVQDRERAFGREAPVVCREVQPRRAKLGVWISRHLDQVLHLLPRAVTSRLHGDDPYASHVSAMYGATVCRAFGHYWDVCVSGSPPRFGHTLVCANCVAMPSSDDLDVFVPGSRHRRDLAALGHELNELWWSVAAAATYTLPRQEVA